MDTVGNKAARAEIAMIKVVAPNVALRVLDRAIQAHGAAGVSQDTSSRTPGRMSRTLRLADGPDEVHLEAIAKLELAKPSGVLLQKEIDVILSSAMSTARPARPAPRAGRRGGGRHQGRHARGGPSRAA